MVAGRSGLNRAQYPTGKSVDPSFSEFDQPGIPAPDEPAG
jgi:hypothetical protein